MFFDKQERIAKPYSKNFNTFVVWFSVGYYAKMKTAQGHESKKYKIQKLPI